MIRHQPGFAALIIMGAVGGWLGGPAATRADSVGLSSLSGYVYVDFNFDGIRDPASEWLLPNVEILLEKEGDPSFSAAATTDQAGFYEFAELDPATYSIVQPAIPAGYLNVMVGVGQLVDSVTGAPIAAYPGDAVNYDQALGIPPQVAGIELPEAARGLDYNFGQIWYGKWWVIGKPPGTPPGATQPVPEPPAVVLLVLGALLLQWRPIERHRRV